MKKDTSTQAASSELPWFTEEEHPKYVEEGIFPLEDDVWSTQKRISRLFGRTIPTINDHLKKVFEEGEVNQATSSRYVKITQTEGKKRVTRDVYVYNTDAVIAIGFRVGGDWGKEFRVWARGVVKENYDPKSILKYL